MADDWKPGDLEEWCPIPDSKDYHVSSEGRVRRGERMLNPCRYSTGYLVADIWFTDGTHRRKGVHTLVCVAFIGPRPGDHECLHINGDPADNRLANLRYGSRQENMRDQYRHGTRVRGDTHPAAKLSYAAAASIRERHNAGESIGGLAREHGVNKKAVQNLLRGKTWINPLTDEEREQFTADLNVKEPVDG